MKAKHLYVPLLVLAAMTGAAQADPISDFKTGTTARVSAASVLVGEGLRGSTGGTPIAKARGSLDFELTAASFGMKYPLKVKLLGRVLSEGLIEYTIDQAYSPSVQIGGGHTVSRVTGRVYLRATSSPGLARDGNVRLSIARASSLTAYTDFGATEIAIKQLTVVGGVPQPPLARFADATSATICSDRVATKHTFSVDLANVAKASGAVVHLDTLLRAGVRVPPGIIVPTGLRSRTFTAGIEPNFVGTVRVTASAGGVERSLDVVVRPHSACVQ